MDEWERRGLFWDGFVFCWCLKITTVAAALTELDLGKAGRLSA